MHLTCIGDYRYVLERVHASIISMRGRSPSLATCTSMRPTGQLLPLPVMLRTEALVDLSLIEYKLRAPWEFVLCTGDDGKQVPP